MSGGRPAAGGHSGDRGASRFAAVVVALVAALAAAGGVAAAAAEVSAGGARTLAFATAVPSPAVAAGEPAASLLDQLEATDLEGRVWTRAELAGRVVLLDFWATWCAPCLAELPLLRRAEDRWGGAGALRILGVCLDRRDRRGLASWLRRHGVGWPQLHDGAGFGGPVARRFGVRVVPRSFLFDRQGKLVARDLRGEALEDALAALLAAPAQPAAGEVEQGAHHLQHSVGRVEDATDGSEVALREVVADPPTPAGAPTARRAGRTAARSLSSTSRGSGSSV